MLAQNNKDGKMENEILYLNNGIMLKKGSTLRLNGPLGEDARFKYIFHAPDNLFDDVKLSMSKPAEPYYAAKDVTVRKIRYSGGKAEEDGKWIVRIRTDKKEDFVCDIVAALESGEISAMQSITNVVQTPQQPETVSAQPDNKATTSPAISVADELAKLKKLMDEGVITKEEFEAQKKKLLDM